MAAAKAGSEWALASLYRDVQPPLLGYLRARSPADAEDVASETWLAVTRSLPRFSGDEGGFRAWVFTIARRRLVDLRRVEARRPRTAPIDDAAAVLPVGGASPPPEEEAIESATTEEALARVA